MRKWKVKRTIANLNLGDVTFEIVEDVVKATELRSNDQWVKFVDARGNVLRMFPSAAIIDVTLEEADNG